MVETVNRPNAANLPGKKMRLSNLSEWAVCMNFLLFTAIVKRCCSIALRILDAAEFY
jgi:hypothetical protein